MVKVEAHLEKDLEHRFNTLDNKRKSILTLAEEYSAWTLPYVFPPVNGSSESVELQLSKDSIGAKAVNNLANKIAMVLFPEQRLFFRLMLDAEGRRSIAQAQGQAEMAGEDAQEMIKNAINMVEQQLLETERDALEHLDYISFTPVAVETAKLLIISGNALLVMHEDRPAQTFSLRDYVVVRDISGAWIEVITKESKAFETFKPDIQDKLRSSKVLGAKQKKSYEDTSEVTVYTQIKLKEDGKYHARQQADCVDLGVDGIMWPKATVPYIPLTWNLVRGEDYGRGLVADYAGAFHAIEVLTEAVLNVASVAGDIKFLVDPSSRANVQELNNSPAGSYHQGREGDITAIGTDKVSDASFIVQLIERYEKQISEAFLLNANMIRDAERVTAEEIRVVANELELSNGGIYSRLASIWQQPMAHILLDHIGFDTELGGVSPKVVTGMASLSREGELNNIRMFLADMAMLNNIPEDVRVRMDIPAFASVVGTNRQVDYQKFIKSEARYQAEVQQQQQMAMQMEQAKAASQLQAEAGKQAVQNEE